MKTNLHPELNWLLGILPRWKLFQSLQFDGGRDEEGDQELQVAAPLGQAGEADGRVCKVAVLRIYAVADVTCIKIISFNRGLLLSESS